jgi:hypothetical protein
MVDFAQSHPFAVLTIFLAGCGIGYLLLKRFRQ